MPRIHEESGSQPKHRTGTCAGRRVSSTPSFLDVVARSEQVDAMRRKREYCGEYQTANEFGESHNWIRIGLVG
jgi:hypothetical protein